LTELNQLLESGWIVAQTATSGGGDIFVILEKDEVQTLAEAKLTFAGVLGRVVWFHAGNPLSRFPPFVSAKTAIMAAITACN
jgi:hypothetical protein